MVEILKGYFVIDMIVTEELLTRIAKEITQQESHSEQRVKELEDVLENTLKQYVDDIKLPNIKIISEAQKALTKKEIQ